MKGFYNPLTMKIHREGYRILLGFFFALTVLNLLLYVFPPHQITQLVVPTASGLMFLFVLNFFRFPYRESPSKPETVMSPADGKVVAVEEVYEKEYFKEKRLLVSIFMSAWNVHINWLPVEGLVKYHRYNPGAFMVAFLPKSSTHNEHTTTVVEHANRKEVLIRQIAGAVARRIVTYPQAGERVKQGTELGFIKFGSRVDLYLPLGTPINVKIGEQVKGNHTAIADFS